MPPPTRNRTVGPFKGKHYALIQYNHDFTLAECDPDGSHEHAHFHVPPKVYCPKAPPGVKRAPNPLPSHLFVKYPRLLIHFETPEFRKLKQRTLREVKFCELLRLHPHPNVASYAGCVVIDGYVRGICFARYPATLSDAVDPLPGHSKETFRYGSGAHRLPKGRAHFLKTLRAGVEHIHGLGYVHNDLKPENVMVKANGAAVVIDFDSVLREGESVWGTAPRTYGWHDPRTGTAEKGNDWDAVFDIGVWLGNEVDEGGKKEFRLPSYEACMRMWEEE